MQTNLPVCISGQGPRCYRHSLMADIITLQPGQSQSRHSFWHDKNFSFTSILYSHITWHDSSSLVPEASLIILGTPSTCRAINSLTWLILTNLNRSPQPPLVHHYQVQVLRPPNLPFRPPPAQSLGRGRVIAVARRSDHAERVLRLSMTTATMRNNKHLVKASIRCNRPT